MDERQAYKLTMEIEREGWIAHAERNHWSGVWTVRCWQCDEEEAYCLRFPVEWHRLVAGLAEERMPFTERDWSKAPVIE